MILATGSSRSRLGFTLVELVIVLTVLGIIAAMAIPSIDGVMDERRAREPVTDLLLMAREVRNRALAEQRPYQIAFDSNGFRASRYFNPYGGKEEFDELQETLRIQQQQQELIQAAQDRGVQIESSSPSIRNQSAMAGLAFSLAYELPDTVDYSIRSWRDTDWRSMEGNEFYRWVFQPSGMCDPIKVQFKYENAFFEVEFNPLTADIKDEISYVE